MAYGTTLAQALILLKSQIGASISVGTADDALMRQLIETKQEWFASVYDWDVLVDQWDVNVVAQAQYVTLPTVDVNGFTYSMNFDRKVDAAVKYSLKWRDLSYGIDNEDYNIFDSTLGQFMVPIMRWRLKTGDRSLFEVWPVSSVTSPTQVVRFTAQRFVKSLRTANVLDPTKTLDLDDRLVTFSVAVDLLTAKDDNRARSVADSLRGIWNTLRGADGIRKSTFGIARPLDIEERRVIPITTVA